MKAKVIIPHICVRSKGEGSVAALAVSLRCYVDKNSYVMPFLTGGLEANHFY